MREKVLFCARYFLYSNDHLAKKFSQQITAIENLGYDVFYIGIMEKHISLFSKGEEICKLIDRRSISIPLVSNIVLYSELYRALYISLSRNDGISFLYCRKLFPLLSSMRDLALAKEKNIKTIMEIPTYPSMSEYNTEKRFMRRLLLYFSDERSHRFAQNVDLYAIIGEHSDFYLNKPAINITNGIDVRSFSVRNKKITDGKIHLLALAIFCRWHGYDRLINGLNEFVHQENQVAQVQIHFVGDDGDGTLKELKNMVNDLSLQEHVLFHGSLFDQNLDDVFNQCDIGIASLGLHRINIHTASVLKIREYFARGLPIVYSSFDTAIQPDYKYVLRVPQNDQAIDMNGIIKLYNECCLINGLSERIRTYAEENMSWESQFKLIFNKLSDV